MAGLLILPSTTVNVAGATRVQVLPSEHLERIHAAMFMLDVTAAATAAGDTLDVYLQSSPDGGNTFDDFVHFTQAIGTGGAVKTKAAWLAGYSPTVSLGPPKDGTLAAGTNQGPVGDLWYVKYVTVQASAVNFTFRVWASPIRR